MGQAGFHDNQLHSAWHAAQGRDAAARLDHPDHAPSFAAGATEFQPSSRLQFYGVHYNFGLAIQPLVQVRFDSFGGPLKTRRLGSRRWTHCRRGR